tara:strand:- start:1398 stop:2039 length:642 start_codon:yes stop_codon:yes gene_type:complete
MNFLDPDIELYSAEHTSPEDRLLKEISRDTYLEVLQPRMLSGHLQGRLLSMFSKMIQPKSILEIGTYTGYSALCLAEGLSIDGELVTIDKNIELIDRVNTYFAASRFSSQLILVEGDAMDVIPQLNKTWDLIFIDADKENYLNYYHMTVPHLKKGGYIIADNVLWSGKVIDPSANDLDTIALREFNRVLIEDSQMEVLLLPVRDGLMVARKKD